MTALFTPTAGLELTAAEIVQMMPVQAVKLSDVSVASNTTLANDAALFVPVAANAVYEITLHLIYTQGTVGQINIGWSAPSGATFDWYAIGLVNSVTAADNGSFSAQARAVGDNRVLGGTSTSCVARCGGRLVVSSTSGTLNLKWAQSSSSATGTTVKAGSYMVARQIA